MTELEQQVDELEALASIYDGDSSFKQVNNTTFQYKVKIARNKRKFLKWRNFLNFLVWRRGKWKIVHDWDNVAGWVSQWASKDLTRSVLQQKHVSEGTGSEIHWKCLCYDWNFNNFVSKKAHWMLFWWRNFKLIRTCFYFCRSDSLKTKIVDILKTEGENWIGCGMTYTLFECVKEHLDELTNELEQELKNAAAAVTENVKTLQLGPVLKTTPTEAPVKKEQLTKSQKRRLWERTDNKGNRARGWDWVDIIRHLSQTGHSRDEPLLTNAQNVTIAQTPMNWIFDLWCCKNDWIKFCNSVKTLNLTILLMWLVLRWNWDCLMVWRQVSGEVWAMKEEKSFNEETHH